MAWNIRDSNDQIFTGFTLLFWQLISPSFPFGDLKGIESRFINHILHFGFCIESMRNSSLESAMKASNEYFFLIADF